MTSRGSSLAFCLICDLRLVPSLSICGAGVMILVLWVDQDNSYITCTGRDDYYWAAVNPFGFCEEEIILPQESWSKEARFPPARSQMAKVKKVRVLSWVSGLSSGPGMSGAYVGTLVLLLPLWLLLIMGSAIREEERTGYDHVKQRPNPSLGSLVERKA